MRQLLAKDDLVAAFPQVLQGRLAVLIVDWTPRIVGRDASNQWTDMQKAMWRRLYWTNGATVEWVAAIRLKLCPFRRADQIAVAPTGITIVGAVSMV